MGARIDTSPQPSVTGVARVVRVAPLLPPLSTNHVLSPDKEPISRDSEDGCLSPPPPVQSPVVSTMAGAAPSALTLTGHQLEMRQRPRTFPCPMGSLMASKMKSLMRGKAIRPPTNAGIDVVTHMSDAAYELVCSRAATYTEVPAPTSIYLPHRSPSVGMTTTMGDLCPHLIDVIRRGRKLATQRRQEEGRHRQEEGRRA